MKKNFSEEKFKNKQLQAVYGYICYGNAYMHLESTNFLEMYSFSSDCPELSIWKIHYEVIKTLGIHITNLSRDKANKTLGKDKIVTDLSRHKALCKWLCRNFIYPYDSDKNMILKWIETLARFVHNVALLMPALLSYFEKWCLIISCCAKTDDTRINHVTKIIGFCLYFLIRIAASILWAVLDPINNIKAICNNPTLGKPAKVILSLISAAIAISAYVFAPYLLFKFAPALMATIVKPLVLLAHWKPIATIATFFKPIATTVTKATTFLAPPKAVALSALYLASGICNAAWACICCCKCARKTARSSDNNTSGNTSNYTDEQKKRGH